MRRRGLRQSRSPPDLTETYRFFRRISCGLKSARRNAQHQRDMGLLVIRTSSLIRHSGFGIRHWVLGVLLVIGTWLLVVMPRIPAIECNGPPGERGGEGWYLPTLKVASLA